MKSIFVKLLSILAVVIFGYGLAYWLSHLLGGWGLVLAIPIAIFTSLFAWKALFLPGPTSPEENANYNEYLSWCKTNGRQPSFKEYTTDSWKNS